MIHYASFGRRLWAFVLSIVVDLIVLGALKAFIGSGDVWPAFGFWVLLHHIGLVVEGGTIGHRLAGLRVVREDGGPLGVLPATFRAIMRLFVSLPPLGLGFLWMLDQPRRQTWHDIVANSVVVRETELQAAAAPDWANDPPWRRRAEPAQDGPVSTPVIDAPKSVTVQVGVGLPVPGSVLRLG